MNIEELREAGANCRQLNVLLLAGKEIMEASGARPKEQRDRHKMMLGDHVVDCPICREQLGDVLGL